MRQYLSSHTRHGRPRHWDTYLAEFHSDRAGITEDVLGRAAAAETDPYTWLLEPLDGATLVLDIACGSAPLHPRRPAAGWIGLDLSAGELASAQRRGALPLVRADAAGLPVASGSVSTVVCSMALMILRPLDAVLREIRRVLHGDGTAVVMFPGARPLTLQDLGRYWQLMIALRRTDLAYPNDRALTRLTHQVVSAGLSVVDDRRRRFELQLPDAAAGESFVRSLYLPGVPARRVDVATRIAAGWAGSSIGVPLRRLVLRPR